MNMAVSIDDLSLSLSLGFGEIILREGGVEGAFVSQRGECRRTF